MKAALLTSSGTLEVQEAEDHPLAPGQVRVSVSYCGICGTDLHWHHRFPAGTVMGHEVAGAIVEVGPDVAGWSVGQRVCVFPAAHCGACPPCLMGRHNICAARPFAIGGPRNRGGYADHVVAPASMLLSIPDGLSDRVAVLAEPLAVAIHGLKVAAADPEDAMLIIGAGAIGLMTILALRAKGFRNIVAVEPNEMRREVVLRAGVTALSPHELPDALGLPPKIVYECAGYPTAIADSIASVAAGGRIILMSFPPDAVLLPQSALMLKEVDIRSAMFYLQDEYEDAIAMLDQGLIDAADIPTTIVPLDQAAEAFAELLEPGSSSMKILLQP